MRFVIEVSTIGGERWNGIGPLFGNAVAANFSNNFAGERTNWNYEFEVANLYF